MQFNFGVVSCSSSYVRYFCVRHLSSRTVKLAVCIGIPASIHTRNATILAFAECRMWAGDGCIPATNSSAVTNTANSQAPCDGTCIVVKRSVNAGSSWSSVGSVVTPSCGGNPMPVWLSRCLDCGATRPRASMP